MAGGRKETSRRGGEGGQGSDKDNGDDCNCDGANVRDNCGDESITVMIIASEEDALSLFPWGLALGGEAEIIKSQKELRAEGVRGDRRCPAACWEETAG